MNDLNPQMKGTLSHSHLQQLGGIEKTGMNPYLIQDLTGFTPQISRLVVMMNYARTTTLNAVRGLTQAQLDHLQDAESNSIGALLAHIASVEFAYQLITFEGRDLNDVEMQRWGAALDLGQAARKEIRSKPLEHYTETLEEVRAVTLREFAKRNDEWLYTESAWGKGTANYYFLWFHVMEDELSHRGQIRWLRKRLG
jgi:uncharacterized damage-inducible protein DinB